MTETNHKNPPGEWVTVDGTTYRHADQDAEIDIGETQGGFYRVDHVTPSARTPIGDGETLREARKVAFEWMSENE